MLRMTNQIWKQTTKALAAICLSALLAARVAAQATAPDLVTNINPALLYYQSFVAAPNYSPADLDYLYNAMSNSLRGEKLPDRFGELVSNCDNEFKLVHTATRQTVPCDWGIDWSAGAETLLPQLARAKQVAQTARFRSAWDLQNGRQSEACEDLIDTLALARRISRDSAVIGVLVDLAMENIICESAAENFGQFSPESLRQLEDGLAAAPLRGTMADVARDDRDMEEKFLAAKVMQLRRSHPGDDAAVMSDLRKYLNVYVEDQELWKKLPAASDGTSDGVLKLVDGVTPWRQRFTEVMDGPYRTFQGEWDKFEKDLAQSGNPLAELIFQPLGKGRVKEFRSEMNLAMLHAAIEYKLHGQAGLQSVPDPFGSGPFTLQRFTYQGVDCGFQLKSALTGTGFPSVFIFLEKDGTPVHLDGLHVGEPL